MNRTELVASIADASGLSKKDGAAALQAALDAIGDALAAGDKVSLVGFGTFEAGQRGAREGRNPQTGKKMTIAAKTVPAFKPGAGLKSKVAG
jgi:DNA-binding protein HU-beta